MEGKHYSYELPFGPLIFHIAEEPHTLRIASDFPLKFKDFPFATFLWILAFSCLWGMSFLLSNDTGAINWLLGLDKIFK